MIIDAHCHVWTWEVISNNYWNELADIGVDFFRRNKLGDITRDVAKAAILDGMMDTDGSKLIASMDNAGVDMTFIMAIDWGLGVGEAKMSVDEINKFYGSIARRYPDRVVAFAGVDPRRPGAAEIFERAVNDYGCRGLKFHPTSGFYPDSEESYKVLAKAEKFGTPLVSHLGPISKPLKSKYARPIYLDAIVSDFPKLTVVGAHLGFCWWTELVNLISAKATTFYADISGQQVRARANFGEFCHTLRTAMNEASAEKFMWGTDNPILEAVMPVKQWLEMIRNLPENAPDGLIFTKEEIDLLVGGNAEKVLAAIPK